MLGLDPACYDVLQGDHRSVVMPWVGRAVPATNGLGLLLHDPNGAPDLGLLERMVGNRQIKKFDVAIYIQATSLKRVLGLPERYDTADWDRLDNALTKVKANWIVREPTGSNQYALCIGSNGPLPGSWSAQHFWPSNTERGRAILEQLTYTAQERKRRLQPGLFDESS